MFTSIVVQEAFTTKLIKIWSLFYNLKDIISSFNCVLFL